MISDDAHSSLQARLEGEMDAVIAELELGKEFETYIRALSLLTDVEHLRNNFSLEIDGLQTFREFLSSTEKKASQSITYPSLPPTVDAVLDVDIQRKGQMEKEADFIPKDLTKRMSRVVTEATPAASTSTSAHMPASSPAPNPLHTPPHKSHTYDYEKERALFESKRQDKVTDDSTSLRTSRAEQEDLSEELIAMTRQLKQNALALSQGLSSDVPLLDQAGTQLQGNADRMSTQRRQLNVFSGNSRATTCLTFTSVIAVFIAWIVLFIVIKLS
ncbi:hypothetical protein E3P94_03671 [Wallemia ichthyophaga]|nr:hypothetical protein E3P95_03662 [Wallemia ichthyophaga]TIA96490.1 hypothetical protein E3P94_03671 [Wallemia ichthyophaga]